MKYNRPPIFLSLILIVLLASCSDTMWTGNAESSTEAEVLFLIEKRGFQTGDTVHFTNHSREASDFQWAFGDGNESSGESAYHIYKNPGDYFPMLSGKTKRGNLSYEMKISVRGASITEPDTSGPGPDPTPVMPSGKITLSHQIIEAGKAITYSFGTNTQALVWEFEAGQTKSKIKGKYSYKTTGNKTVMAYWQNKSTFLDSAQIQVYSASFRPQNLNVNGECKFSAKAPFPVKWDLGSSQELNEVSGQKSYDQAGTYTIKLLDARNDKVLKVFTINVSSPPDAAKVNSMLDLLGNEGSDAEQKDEVAEKLYRLCDKGKNTLVTGQESGILEDLILKLRIESNEFTNVEIQTEIINGASGKISSIKVNQYNNTPK